MSGEYLMLFMHADGRAHVDHPGMCAAEAAARLRALADVMQAAHDAELAEAHQPVPESVPESAGPDLEPLDQALGRLDRERALWRDGAGHVWDLSLTWADQNGNRWTWTRRMDRWAPVMRMHGSGMEEPLDSIRGWAGPLVPVVGGGS